MTKTSSVVLAMTLLLLLPPAAAASGSGTRNLVYSITVVETAANGEAVRRSTLITARDGTSTDLSTGWRVPIPITKVDAPGPPVTSFSYQEVGLSAVVEGFITEGGGVHARGSVEVSSVEPAGEPTARHPGGPTIAHFSQRFDVLLPDGSEVVLAEGLAPGGGSMSLALAARVQP